MPQPIPLNQSSRNMVLQLLNRDNNTSETFDQISFGPVAPMPTGAIRNTTLVVSPVPGSGRVDDVPIYYNRLFIDRLFLADPLPIPFGDYPETHDVVTYLNTTYGLHIDPEDYVNQTLVGTTYQLVMSDPSYAWLGTLNIEMSPEGIPVPAGTYLNLGDGSLFAVENNVLLMIGNP